MVGMNVFGAGVEQLTHSLFGQAKGTSFISFLRKEHNYKQGNTPSRKLLCSWLYLADLGWWWWWSWGVCVVHPFVSSTFLSF